MMSNSAKPGGAPAYFAYMDEEKIVAFHLEKTVAVQRFEIVNFKLQNLKNVKDFTFQDNQIEILMPNQVVIYTYNNTGSLNKYIRAEKADGTGEGTKERTDLNMLAFWRLSVPQATEAQKKVRVLVNGIKELTYIEDWEDNSPSSMYEKLYKPVPLRCQSGEIVIKITTDKSDFYTFYVLRDK